MEKAPTVKVKNLSYYSVVVRYKDHIGWDTSHYPEKAVVDSAKGLDRLDEKYQPMEVTEVRKTVSIESGQAKEIEHSKEVEDLIVRNILTVIS